MPHQQAGHMTAPDQLQNVKLTENGGDKLVHGSGGISQPRAE